MDISDGSTFGELLQSLRVQKNVNQHYLATKLDVHRNTISKWERGICLPESKAIVLELAHQLHLDVSNTQRLLEASLTAFSMYWHMPFPRNPFFTGRDTILQVLHEMLGRERTAAQSQSYALSGIGGIGKTQIAIEYAYHHAHDYTAVLWVTAETRESIITSFTALADVLHLSVPQARHDQEHIVAMVRRWLNEHREWLLIFDNVEDLSLIKPILPAARSGAILLTTRLQDLGGVAEVISLERMTPEEGTQFLLHRTRLLKPNMSDTSLSPQEIQASQEIVALMDGLPLALDQAGAYTEVTQCSLQNYLQLFHTDQQHLLDERNIHTDHPLSVSKTFILAFERLKQSNPAACTLLTVCALLAPEAIPEDFFGKGAMYLGPSFEAFATDSLYFNTAIKALQTYSLIQRDATTRTVMIHRLVQSVIKGYLSKTELHIWITRVVRAMSQLFPSDEKTQNDYWEISEQLLPHALVCIALGEQWGEDIALYIALTCHVAMYYLECVRYNEAALLYERVLCVGEVMPYSEHSSISEALCDLADLYFEHDKYQEAEVLYKNVLSIQERILGAEHPVIAETLCRLCVLYCIQGQYAEAELLYERALSIQERSEYSPPQIGPAA